MSALKSTKELRAEADKNLVQALVEIGFYRNVWNFDPYFVRVLFSALTTLFTVLSVWVWTHIGAHRWLFTSFGLVLGLLLWYWYYKVEYGGGQFMFSPEWRDTYLKSEASQTFYIVKIRVGYELDAKASIPFSSFEMNEDGTLDVAWLADELEQQFPMAELRKRVR